MTASTELDSGIVESQLERILSSEHFADAARLKQFLSHLIAESLAGRAETLKGYAIGLDVFDRPEDFDPSTDTIVRVQAGRLRSRLDLYYAKQGKDDPLRIMIPKGSYAPVFEVMFDPEMKSSSDVQSPGTESPRQRYTIAVMPLDNLSGDPAQEFLADGITEEIINALTRFREFDVISRHSTYHYKDRPQDSRELGSILGARYIVEGSVRRWEDQVRVTAQLIDASTGTHLASEVYDRKISAQSLFEIQEDIASRIAAEIAEPHGVIHHTGARRRQAQTESLDAYECRLLASEYWREPSREAHARVAALLEKAVKIDPSYAGAWAMLAIVYGDELRGGYDLGRDTLPLDRALDAASRSVDLDPMNAVGYHALFMTHYHRGEFNRFRTAADKALRLNPCYPDMLADLGGCMGLQGDWDAGARLVERATELSPNPPAWYACFPTMNCYRLKDYDEALVAARRIGNSAWNVGPMFECMALGQLGRLDEASELIEDYRARGHDPEAVMRGAIAIWHVPRDFGAHMLEGLTKAGVKITE